MSYLTQSEQSAIPPELLPGPPVTIAISSQSHWPNQDIAIGGYIYHYSRLHDEFIRYDVLYWVHKERNQTKDITK